MSNETSGNGGTMTFLGLLGIVFITLKLTSVIDWSWWWVLAPLWGPFALAALIAVVAIPFAIIKTKRDVAAAASGFDLDFDQNLVFKNYN